MKDDGLTLTPAQYETMLAREYEERSQMRNAYERALEEVKGANRRVSVAHQEKTDAIIAANLRIAHAEKAWPYLLAKHPLWFCLTFLGWLPTLLLVIPAAFAWQLFAICSYRVTGNWPTWEIWQTEFSSKRDR